MPHSIFWWFFTVACLSAFFFGYGMVEGWDHATASREGDSVEGT